MMTPHSHLRLEAKDQELQRWGNNLLARYRRENPSFPLWNVVDPTEDWLRTAGETHLLDEKKAEGKSVSSHENATLESRIYSLFSD